MAEVRFELPDKISTTERVSSRLPSATPSINQIPKRKDDVPISLSWKNVDIWTRGSSDSKKEGLKQENGEVKERTQSGLEADPPKPKSKFLSCIWPSPPSKHLIRNVSGVAKPGELVALMGASGAGKTTLLNYLAFRTPNNLRVSGERYINGYAATARMISSVSAYIEQEDLFFGALTVREHLEFHASLRLPQGTTTEEKQNVIDDLMSDFGLLKCADTQIGVAGRIQGISGGEMKRLSLASELLWNPQLLICDEPTTGLDIFMATAIVKQLKALAFAEKTIICTIHQPSATIFEMFDRIILLAEGRVAFTGSVPACLDFFTENGYECPPNFNTADYFVQTLAISPTRNPENLKKVHKLCDAFAASAIYAEMQETFRKEAQRRDTGAQPPYKLRTGYQVSWISQFKPVLGRAMKSTIKDPFMMLSRLFETTVISLLIGGVYFQKGHDHEVKLAHFMSLAGLMYLTVTNLTLQFIYCALDGFQSEIPVFFREHFNGMYRLDVYFCAKQISDLPIYLILPILFSLIIHFMVGFPLSGAEQISAISITYGFSVLIALCAGSYGYFLSSICPTLNVALIYGVAMLLPMMLYSGYAIRSSALNRWTGWCKYLSWFWYADEALMSYRLDYFQLKECKGVNNCDVASVLEAEFDYRKSSLVFDVFGMCCIIATFRTISYVALYRKSKQQNK